LTRYPLKITSDQVTIG